jgi:hypothetical protein
MVVGWSQSRNPSSFVIDGWSLVKPSARQNAIRFADDLSAPAKTAWPPPQTPLAVAANHATLRYDIN